MTRKWWVCDIDRADGTKEAVGVMAYGLDEAVYRALEKAQGKPGDRMRIFLQGYRREKVMEIDQTGKPREVSGSE